MNVLWITWKDMGHPEAGGAEVVCSELSKRLQSDGHSVTLLTTNYPGANPGQTPEGIPVFRAGSNRYLHPFFALVYFVFRLRGRYDVVIEEVQGGCPYFCVLFERRAKRFAFYHQLARINWLYEVPKPFSYIGYGLLVPVATRFFSLFKIPVITVSESTRQELAKYGFSPERTHIISEGISIQPAKNIATIKKYKNPTVLSHGSMRAMKRTIDQIKAFEIAKKEIPKLRMKISGNANSSYGKKVLDYIARSPHKKDIEYLGRTTDEQKIELMQKCHAILVTSIEEGWGLIVTEANSQGTPAVVYDVAGLRDSVKNGETGIITAPVPQALADGIVELLGTSGSGYGHLRKKAWAWSKQIAFQRSYKDLMGIFGKIG